MSVPSFWAENEQVGQYVGYAWYRTTFQVPAMMQGKKVRLGFGAVDEQAWVYINGRLAGEHTEQSAKKTYGELWDEPFTIDIPAALLKFGAVNEVVVRVHNSAANGGLWRGVIAHTVAER
jgi:sialate O-acetylesterase